jgi:SAM-dependent methyltransferase
MAQLSATPPPVSADLRLKYANAVKRRPTVQAPMRTTVSIPGNRCLMTPPAAVFTPSSCWSLRTADIEKQAKATHDPRKGNPMGTYEVAFSAKYTLKHSRKYHEKHRRTLGRRLSNWREQQMAARALALAGHPATVLDLPCGTGRFWPLLAGKQDRTILAADSSEAMLRVAREVTPPDLLARVETLQRSAFDIRLGSASVDHIFCMRLLHHITRAEDRLAILKEFHRVTRDTVAVSLWVDGNYKAVRRRNLESRRTYKTYQNRIVLPRAKIEQEFAEAGFAMAGYFDFLKFYAMWRLYVLKKQPA